MEFNDSQASAAAELGRSACLRAIRYAQDAFMAKNIAKAVEVGDGF